MGKFSKALGLLRAMRSRKRPEGPSRKGAKCRQRCQRLETLESRHLLSAGMSYTPPHETLGNSGAFLTGPNTGSTYDIAMQYLTSHAGNLGLTPSDVTAARVSNVYTDADTGITHLYLRQTLQGVDVANTAANVNISADGRVINVGADFVPNLLSAQVTGSLLAAPSLPATAAVQSAGAQLEVPGADTSTSTVVSTADDLVRSTVVQNSNLSLDPITSKLQYVATESGVSLAWSLQLRTPDKQHWYDVTVDATSGSLLTQNDWVDHYTDQYLVYQLPTEAPNDTRGPGAGSRVLVSADSVVDPTASPQGWIDERADVLGWVGAGGLTQGNNVMAYEDHAGLDAPRTIPSLVLTECSDNDTAFVELQNVSSRGINLSGWRLVVNDATQSDPNARLIYDLQQLKATADAGEVLYVTDNSRDHYFGAKIPWNRATGKGWAMILNPQTSIADFVAWGYTSSEIRAMAVDIGGLTVSVRTSGAWSRDGVVYAGSPTATLQRQGNQDNDWAVDFRWQAPTKGAQNVGLTSPFLTPYADAGPSQDFSFAIDPSKDPTTYTSAAVTQLFYTNNVLHDVHYGYGFTEAAGNFQYDNFGRGGAGGDAVRAEAQDGGGTDNANFATPPDGFQPTMQMYLWDLSNPRRDGDLDNGIMVHEYGHGVSTRLVGGPANSSALNAQQSAGMGEGWSDWWALMFTQKATDKASDKRSMGTYVFGQPQSGKGIRQYAYSTDMVNGATDKNARYTFPLTYGDYNLYQEVHAAGEIWCATLWDLNWMLIDKYATNPDDPSTGFDPDIGKGFSVQATTDGWVNENPMGAGNRLALRLVMDSLKLMPNLPTFLDARDALLQADFIVNGGRDTREIWQAFARRGMGVNAYDGGSANALQVVEDFTSVPDAPVVVKMDAAPQQGAYRSVTLHFSQPVDPTTFSLDDIARFQRPGAVDMRSRLAAYNADISTNFDSVWWPNTLVVHEWVTTPGVTPPTIGYASMDLVIPFQPTMLEGTYGLAVGPSIFSRYGNVTGKANDLVQHQMDQNRNLIEGEGPTATGQDSQDAFVGSFTIDRSPGPDGQGYDAVSVNPVTNPYRSTLLKAGDSGVMVAMDRVDDTSVYLDLGKRDLLGNPNLFRFYDTNYNGLYINANGLITFNGFDPTKYALSAYKYWYIDSSRYSLTSDLTTNPTWPTIAPFWTDWTTDEYGWKLVNNAWVRDYAVNPNGTVLYKFNGDDLIVQWDQVPYLYAPPLTPNYPDVPSLGGRVTFQAILKLNTGFYNGDIYFNYPDIANATSTEIVGIKATGSQGAKRLMVSMADATSPYFYTGVDQDGILHYSGIHILQSAGTPGKVFNDANGNGSLDTGEVGLPGWIVYADLNNDAQFDWVNDIGAVTDANGNYTLSYFAAGSYTIREVPQGGWIQTGATSQLVSVVTGSLAPDVNFGNLANNHSPQILDAAFYVPEHWQAGTPVIDAPVPGTPLWKDPNGPAAGDGQLIATDPDGQSLQYTILSGNLGKAFRVNTSGVLEVNDPTVLAANVVPQYVLTVQVTDSGFPALSAVATVVVTVLPSNQAPSATDDTYSTPTNQTLTIPQPGVVANDSDPNGDALQPVLLVPPVAGTLVLNADGSFSYTPDANYIGTDSFTYQAWDGHYTKDLQGNDTNVKVLSNVATVRISVGAAQNTLTLEMPVDGLGNPLTLWESRDTYSKVGKVILSQRPASDVVVTLTSKNPQRLQLPPTVLVRAGETEATFDMTAVDDADVNGSVDAKVIATAVGFYSSAKTVHVGDNEIAKFAFDNISSPQQSAQTFPITVFARNSSDETITTYAGGVALAAIGPDGVIPVTAVLQGGVPEQPFTNGEAHYLVTLGGAGSGVYLTATDNLTPPHSGLSNSFTVAPAAPSYFAWDYISSPQSPGTPVAVTITAHDTAGGLSTGFNSSVHVTGGVVATDTNGNAIRPTLLISELSDASVGYVELQNVSGAPVSLAGWTLLLNDPTKSDPSAALTVNGQRVNAYPLTNLTSQADLNSGDVLTMSDTQAQTFFGRIIPWGASTAKGWAMLLNPQKQVADFVAWGYNEFQIQSMLPTLVTSVNDTGTRLSVGTNWYGAGAQYAATATTTLQRCGDRDGNTLDDFAYQAPTKNVVNNGIAAGVFQESTKPVAVAPIASPSLSITECGDSDKAFIEIQNVATRGIDLMGWRLVINDPSAGNPNAVVSTIYDLQQLKTAIGVGEVLYVTDDLTDHYFGANIPWNRSTGKGWAMILDPQMNVADFVSWGYSASQIQTMTPVISGHTVRVGSAWTGGGVVYAGGPAATLQRLGSQDNQTAGDFRWDAPSMGTKNIGLVTPFQVPIYQIPVAAQDTGLFLNGIWTGTILVPSAATQLVLRASDGQGHVGASIAFNVVYQAPAGAATPAIFDPAGSHFFIRYTQTTGVADQVAGFGPAPNSWIPLAGDWNGDGTTSVGLYDPATSVFYLTNSATGGMAQTAFGFGVGGKGWIPVVGDWDGNGTTTIGLYDPSLAVFYLRNSNTTGMADLAFGYGARLSNWTPIVGDWNGDGITTVGLFIPASSSFLLRNSNNTGMADIAFGYGPAGGNWKPLAGDWNGGGRSGIGLYDGQTGMFYLRNTLDTGVADVAFGYGPAGANWKPLVGNWSGTHGSNLLAAEAPLTSIATSSLTPTEVQPIVAAALSRFAAAGVDAGVLAQMGQTQFVVAALPGAQLGRTEGNVIYLDVNAAGRGWFVDDTPAVDEEFSVAVGGAQQTAVDSRAVDHVDLLTVVAHELGHIAGLADLDLNVDSLMGGSLGTGLRRAPKELDALFASGLL